MEIKDVQRKSKTEIKEVQIHVRVTTEQSKFMKDNNISPTSLLETAIKELMQKKK